MSESLSPMQQAIGIDPRPNFSYSASLSGCNYPMAPNGTHLQLSSKAHGYILSTTSSEVNDYLDHGVLVIGAAITMETFLDYAKQKIAQDPNTYEVSWYVKSSREEPEPVTAHTSVLDQFTADDLGNLSLTDQRGGIYFQRADGDLSDTDSLSAQDFDDPATGWIAEAIRLNETNNRDKATQVANDVIMLLGHKLLPAIPYRQRLITKLAAAQT